MKLLRHRRVVVCLPFVIVPGLYRQNDALHDDVPCDCLSSCKEAAVLKGLIVLCSVVMSFYRVLTFVLSSGLKRPVRASPDASLARTWIMFRSDWQACLRRTEVSTSDVIGLTALLGFGFK